jgi:hypothetical protein
MNKYPCELIEDLMPLYIEGDVSDATKDIMEKHIKECKNCRTLAQEYSNDELKIENFKEDLPQANTFEKLIKRLKTWGLVACVGIILAAMAIGIIGYKAGEDSKKDLLTLRTIVRTFNKQGLSLKKDKIKSLDDFNLNEIKPAIFSIGENKDTLLIYTFKSFSEREKILEETGKFSDSFSFEQVPYKAKNALIVYMPSQIPETEEGYASIGKTRKLIFDIVFKNLNDGKERVYKGESASWEGTFTLKYYEHWVQDENGLHRDSFSWHYPVIKYKMSDIDVVGSITFEFKSSHGSGISTGLMLNKDGYADSGSGGGNGAIPSESDDVKFTIKWGDKEEHIVLKAQ